MGRGRKANPSFGSPPLARIRLGHYEWTLRLRLQSTGEYEAANARIDAEHRCFLESWVVSLRNSASPRPLHTNPHSVRNVGRYSQLISGDLERGRPRVVNCDQSESESCWYCVAPMMTAEGLEKALEEAGGDIRRIDRFHFPFVRKIVPEGKRDANAARNWLSSMLQVPLCLLGHSCV